MKYPTEVEEKIEVFNRRIKDLKTYRPDITQSDAPIHADMLDKIDRFISDVDDEIERLEHEHMVLNTEMAQLTG